MSVLLTSCPSCAGQIEFRAGSSIVVVCPFCRSAVARTDRGLSDLGKVAEIISSQSPLRIGLKGLYNGHGFELTGRAQLGHEAGGVWDEWYATFDNGWVGWLAEAQGRFYLTFFQPVQEGSPLPSYDSLRVGAQVAEIPAKAPFVVSEKGVAKSLAAEGEIPYRLEPGEQSLYADISSEGGLFGTIDYGMNPPWVFVGKQVTLDEIGLGQAKARESAVAAVASAAVKCPNCAGPLELSAPDRTERVACPFCDSLLDVNDGALVFLKSLDKTNKPRFAVELGAVGKFMGDVPFKVIGASVRSVTVEGEKYFWHEYLLYNPMVGFRWLVHSEGHWNFVESVNPGDVSVSGVGSTCAARYKGRKFGIFQEAEACVEYVTGEFYWRVEQGERVTATDFVDSPSMLSCEYAGNEINWSLGTYVTAPEIEKAFGIGGVAKPSSVGPNQPFTGGFYITTGLAFVVALLIAAAALLPFTGIERTVLKETVTLERLTAPNTPQTAFSGKFELKPDRNVQIVAAADVSNTWVDLDVDLVNEASQEVESVNIPIEYYTGTDGDGAWSEGGKTQDASLSSLPGGVYTLRIEGTWEKSSLPMQVDIHVKQSVVRGVNFLCALGLLALFPAVGIARWITFAGARSGQSSFGTLAGRHLSGR
jgi:Zn finger protein HypA/HybF involved in hydrogenase expression